MTSSSLNDLNLFTRASHRKYSICFISSPDNAGTAAQILKTFAKAKIAVVNLPCVFPL